MKYLCIGDDEITTKENAEIVRMRMAKHGLGAQIGVFIPLSDLKNMERFLIVFGQTKKEEAV